MLVCGTAVSGSNVNTRSAAKAKLCLQFFQMSDVYDVGNNVSNYGTFRQFDLFEHPAVVQAYTAGTVLAKGKINSISYIKHDLSILSTNTFLRLGEH